MLKKIGLFVLMTGFTVQLQAAQCPNASVFSHVKGQPWKLSSKAQLEGWRLGIVSHDANDSDLTEISEGAVLEANLTQYWLSNTQAECIYGISPTDLEYVTIANIRQIDMNNIPQPPFEKHTNPEYYKCFSTNSTSNYCNWHWKIG